MNNYKRAIPIYIGVVLAILFTACESNSTSLMSGLSQYAQINDPTSSPTLSLQQRDFRADGVMGAYKHQLVQVMGIMQPVNDKIALNLRLNRHLYTDTFFVKGIPNSIIMSETALKEWERDYELQFSIQFKF